MPVLVNPSRFAGGGGGGTLGSGYATAVLADSPWGFWKLTETSNSNGDPLVDASPNGRNMALVNTGGAPTMNQTGPSSFTPAILWPDSDSTNAATSVNFNSSTGTVECWFYLTATPTDSLSLAACQNNAGGSITKYLRVNTDLSISFGLTATQLATSAASAVSLNTWHHVVGSVGAAQSKVRLDKVTVGTRTNTTSSTSNLPASIHRRESATGKNSGGALIAAVAVWASQLSNAQTDAHYDAMFA